MVKTSQEFNGVGFVVGVPWTSYSSNVACGWVVLWCGVVLLFPSCSRCILGVSLPHAPVAQKGLSPPPCPSSAVGCCYLFGAYIMTRCSLEGNANIKCGNSVRFYNPLHNKSIILLCFSTPSKILATWSVSHIPLIK